MNLPKLNPKSTTIWRLTLLTLCLFVLVSCSPAPTKAPVSPSTNTKQETSTSVPVSSPTPRPTPKPTEPVSQEIDPARDWGAEPGIIKFILSNGLSFEAPIGECRDSTQFIDILGMKFDVDYEFPVFTWQIGFERGVGIDPNGMFIFDSRKERNSTQNMHISIGTVNSAVIERGPDLSGRTTFSEDGITVNAVWQCPTQ